MKTGSLALVLSLEMVLKESHRGHVGGEKKFVVWVLVG
jgi:hypothetical protein